MKISKLKQQFLAAFPVIGPHSNIEAELMLAGTKPIAQYGLFDLPPNAPVQFKKEVHDRLRLDRAVADGLLVSTDRTFEFEEGYPVTFRFFAQPENEQEMIEYADGYETAETHTKDYGRYLGYRRRDIALFRLNCSLPDIISRKLIDLNAPFQRAHLRQQLESAGIENPSQYMRDLFETLENDSPT